MALTHHLHGEGFAFFRDVCLNIHPILSLLKSGERFGFYLESEKPYFRLKIELSSNGSTRTLLFPEQFQEYPETLSGKVRLKKFFPNQNLPYETVIEVEQSGFTEIINQILRVSYQMSGTVHVSKRSDQSLLLLKLSEAGGTEKIKITEENLKHDEELFLRFDSLLVPGESNPEELIKLFHQHGFEYLAQRTIRFHCDCSRERMIQNLDLYRQADPEPLFDENRKTVSLTCEYCKTEYLISAGELDPFLAVLN